MKKLQSTVNKEIAEKLNIEVNTVNDVINALEENIAETTAEGNELELYSLGIFKPKNIKARKGFWEGQVIELAPMISFYFDPSDSALEKLNSEL